MPTSIKDDMPNRKYVTATFGASAAAPVAGSWDTGLGARDGKGILISRIEFGLKGVANAPPSLMAATTAQLRAQVTTGDRVDLLAADDPTMIANMDWFKLTTMGTQQFPLQWVGPILIASKKLSFVCEGTNDAGFNDEPMLWTVWFNYVKLTPQDYLEIAEQKGIL